MYILYGGGVTRALGPQMVLEEAELPYDLREIDIWAGEHRKPEFLAVNPAGYVPALVTPEGQVLHEAAAIMVYLADRHRLDDLAPPPRHPDRGLFYCRLFFFTNDIQPSMKRIFYAARFSTAPEDAPRIRARAVEMARERWTVLDRYLAEAGPYHLGERFSLVDLNMALWAAYALEGSEALIDDCPGVRRCFELVAARPKAGPLLKQLRDAISRR